MENNPSTLDRILKTASSLGLGYLDYKLAKDQAEASAVLQYQETANAQTADRNATWGLGGTTPGPLGLPGWVLPAAFVGFGAVVIWKAVAK